MAEKRSRYAVCVQAEPDEDLQVRKVYEVLPDELAAKRGHLRVVDESGEDYLYPAESFILLDLRIVRGAIEASRLEAREPAGVRLGSGGDAI